MTDRPKNDFHKHPACQAWACEAFVLLRIRVVNPYSAESQHVRTSVLSLTTGLIKSTIVHDIQDLADHKTRLIDVRELRGRERVLGSDEFTSGLGKVMELD